MFIVDTDILIEFLRGNPLLAEKFPKHQEELFTTSINIAELVYGAWKSKKQEKSLSEVEVLLQNIRILNFTVSSAHRFGEIKSALERKGMPLSDTDLFIASIALASNSIFVTHNTKHFLKIPGLKVIDWLKL